MTQSLEAQIQADINKLLLKESRNRERFIRKVEDLGERYGGTLYPSLLYATAHLEFEKRAAKKHWREILRHWGTMSKNVKREVDFRVALLDYFIDVNRRIKNPKIIEIKIFQKTQQESLTDELTQLYNYRYFVKALSREIVRGNRYHAPLTLVIFDVDDFKRYNDTNGHLAGNKALKKLAQIIKKAVRDVDIVARYGGEEFALILPETNKEGGLVISDRIRKRVQRSTFSNGQKQPLKKFTISGGVATLNIDAATGSNLMKKADQALYRAKAMGKNQVAVYTDEKRDGARVRAEITGRLSMTSDAGDFLVVRNISEGGVLFHFHKAIPLGKLVQLTLNLANRKSPINCKAKVRRVEELKKNKKYEIGASIVQIREPEKKALKRFLDRLIKQRGK